MAPVSSLAASTKLFVVLANPTINPQQNPWLKESLVLISMLISMHKPLDFAGVPISQALHDSSSLKKKKVLPFCLPFQVWTQVAAISLAYPLFTLLPEQTLTHWILPAPDPTLSQQKTKLEFLKSQVMFIFANLASSDWAHLSSLEYNHLHYKSVTTALLLSQTLPRNGSGVRVYQAQLSEATWSYLTIEAQSTDGDHPVLLNFKTKGDIHLTLV